MLLTTLIDTTKDLLVIMINPKFKDLIQIHKLHCLVVGSGDQLLAVVFLCN